MALAKPRQLSRSLAALPTGMQSKATAAAQPLATVQQPAVDNEAHLRDIDQWKSVAAAQTAGQAAPLKASVPQLGPKGHGASTPIAHKAVGVSALSGVKPGSHPKPVMSGAGGNLVGRLPGEAPVPAAVLAKQAAAGGNKPVQPIKSGPSRITTAPTMAGPKRSILKQPVTAAKQPVRKTVTPKQLNKGGVMKPPSRMANIPKPHNTTPQSCEDKLAQYHHMLSPWIFIVIFGSILLLAGLGYLYFKFSWQPKARRAAAATTGGPAVELPNVAGGMKRSTGAGSAHAARAAYWQKVVEQEAARMNNRASM